MGIETAIENIALRYRDVKTNPYRRAMFSIAEFLFVSEGVRGNLVALHMVILKELKEVAPVLKFYLDAFPKEERREVEDMERLLLEEPRYYLLGIELEGQIVGLLSYWDLVEWICVEHFAIDASYRGEGIGAEVMKSFVADKRQIALEVEPPEEEMACRRIGFYERLGFKLWDIPYLQPPYRVGGAPVPLRIMTRGEEPTEALITEIHRVVYGI